MASSQTSVTVLGTACPWIFGGTGVDNPGAVNTVVPFASGFNDGSSTPGSPSALQNASYRYGSHHSSPAGETAPPTVAVTPGSQVVIQYASGTVNTNQSGATLCFPAGAAGHPASGANETDSNGYNFPGNQILGCTTGQGGIVGCFTDSSHNVIAGSLWDWNSRLMTIPGFVLTAAQPTGTTFPITITGCTFGGGAITITGAWLGGAGNAYKGLTFVTSGFTSAGNNSGGGGFPCTASSAGSITLTDAGGASSAAGTPIANLAVGAVTLYTGTITGGAANAFSGISFIILGFDTAGNNGTYVCVASTATTLTLQNTFNSQTLDTHAGTAQQTQSISLTAPAAAAFVSIGIMDTVLWDNSGSFATTVYVFDSASGYTGDQTFQTRYPIGIACPANSADFMKPAVFMEASFAPLLDTSLLGWMSGYFGQLFPHGAQNSGGAPAGSNGQNFPY